VANNLRVTYNTYKVTVTTSVDSQPIVISGGFVESLSIGDVTTLAPEADATASLTLGPNGQQLNLGIPGGAGSTALSGMTDVDLTDLADQQVLVYDASTSSWINATADFGSGGDDGSYDPLGAADDALSSANAYTDTQLLAAKSYTDDSITALSLGSASTHAAEDFEVAGAASATLNDANSYTDTQIQGLDAISVLYFQSGTMGQVLTKNSADDLDFDWVDPAASGLDDAAVQSKIDTSIDALSLGDIVTHNDAEYVHEVDLSPVAFSGSYDELTGIPALADVATSGDYGDLINNPTLGTAAAQDSASFATAAQGALADSAVQPSDLGTIASHAATDYILTTSRAVANGVASLDSAGKVPLSQLPSSIMEYQGVWDASTNSPSLADGTGGTGDVYRVSVAGTQDLGSGITDFEVGDYAIYNGSTWEKSDTTDAVSAVAGLVGNVTAVSLMTELGAAPLASPAFTDTPTAPTATDGTNSTQIATTAFVKNVIIGPQLVWVYASGTAQSIPPSTYTLMAYNTVAQTVGNDITFDTSTHLFTVNADGTYILSAGNFWGAGAAGKKFRQAFQKNGASYAFSDTPSDGGSFMQQNSAPTYCSAGDTLGMLVYQGETVAITSAVGPAYTWASLTRIG